MPKKVIDTLLDKIRISIAEHYELGDKYLTVRELASLYQVSLQTAHKAIRILKSENIVAAKPKTGTVITSKKPINTIKGKTLGVFSNLNDPIYDMTFYKTIEKSVESAGIQVRFTHLEERKLPGLALAKHILDLNLDCGMFLSYTNSALSLYHLFMNQFIFVSDIGYEELPMIPTIQTDNYRHSFEAGKRQASMGYSSFVMIGCQSRQESLRYKGYVDGIGKTESAVRYIQLVDPSGIAKMSNTIHYLEEDTAVFCADFPLVDMVASKFLQYQKEVKNDNFMIYDCAENSYLFHGLPLIRSAAPGIIEIAQGLSQMIIKILETDIIPQPAKILI